MVRIYYEEKDSFVWWEWPRTRDQRMYFSSCTTINLCDLEQTVHLFWAMVSWSTMWNKDSIACHDYFIEGEYIKVIYVQSILKGYKAVWKWRQISSVLLIVLSSLYSGIRSHILETYYILCNNLWIIMPKLQGVYILEQGSANRGHRANLAYHLILQIKFY